MTVFRTRLRISGRVQGVGFRWFAKEEARGLGLAGWVRNDPDGAVVLEIEGPADAVSQFRRAVSRGPEAAHVAAVEELPHGTEPLPMPFAVERR